MRQGGSEKRTDGPEQYGRTKQKKKGEGDTDMSLMYTEEQKALIALVKEMAENEIKPYVTEAVLEKIKALDRVSEGAL